MLHVVNKVTKKKKIKVKQLQRRTTRKVLRIKNLFYLHLKFLACFS